MPDLLRSGILFIVETPNLGVSTPAISHPFNVRCGDVVKDLIFTCSHLFAIGVK
jgi:hypothetical protein